ncbi:hypothetical protein ARMGADRAFT_1093414 [Armillaria gallica]|uniref:Uncharacterized protein n=1 Tax=Armillaria gallica TaxID=47427 RepID=A0A2H3C7U6_ARMGA|nr:hypothetical protein ARMGADRAFT_1093414 [Armillaria gallica]
MWENFRYGHNDWLQWPQAYVEQFPHLACIHWVTPADPKDTFHSLYHGLTKYDFVECNLNSLVEGVGLLRQSSFLILQAACNVVVESMKSVDGSASVSCSMRGHLSVIELLLRCLHALPTSYLHICLTFTETQHVALELRAFVEYMTVFKPLMDSPETDAPAMPVDTGLMGSYVHDATVLQRFFKVGIPVWRIVDMKDLPVAGEGSGLAKRRWQEVTKIMEGYIEFPLCVDNDASTVFWWEKAYETLMIEECMEILWELA